MGDIGKHSAVWYCEQNLSRMTALRDMWECDYKLLTADYMEMKILLLRKEARIRDLETALSAIQLTIKEGKEE